MVKKRIVKKRVAKRKGTIKVSKDLDKVGVKKADATKKPMSKMEYEMNMMDPRFRAMMAQGNMSSLGNQQLNERYNSLQRELETRAKNMSDEQRFTNMATLQKTQLEYKQKAKQRKAELENVKNEAQLKDVELKEKLEKQKHDHDLEMMRQKEELMKTKSERELRLMDEKMRMTTETFAAKQKISDMKNEVEIQKRVIQEQEIGRKNFEEMNKAGHERIITAMTKEFKEKIDPIVSGTGKVKRKLKEMEQKQLNEEKLANAVAERNRVMMEKTLQNQLLPIQKEINDTRRQIDEAGKKNMDVNKLADVLTEKQTVMWDQTLQKNMVPLQNEINETSRQMKMTNQKFTDINKLADVLTEKTIMEVKNQFTPMIQKIELQKNTIDRHLELLSQQNKSVQDLLKVQHQLDIETFKKSHEEVMGPLKQDLESLKQSSEKNKIANDQILERMKITHEIDVAESQATPEQIQEYHTRLNEAKKTNLPYAEQLRLSNKLKEIKLKNESMQDEIIANGVDLFGLDFALEEVGTDAFKEKLKLKETEIQEKRSKLFEQKMVAERNLKTSREMEEMKLQELGINAQIEAMNHSDEYNSALTKKVEAKARFDQEIKRMEQLKKEIVGFNEQVSRAYEDAHGRAITVIRNPLVEEVLPKYMKQEDIKKGELPKLEQIPKIVDDAMKRYNEARNAIDNMDSNALQDEVAFAAQGFSEALANRGIDINGIRENMRVQRDTADLNARIAIEEKTAALNDKIKWQKRAAQGRDFGQRVLDTAVDKGNTPGVKKLTNDLLYDLNSESITDDSYWDDPELIEEVARIRNETETTPI